MKRKTELIYPNCSELVVALDLCNIEDIREAVKLAEEITGWKLCLMINGHSAEKGYYYRDIEPDDLELGDDEYGDTEIAVKLERFSEFFTGEESGHSIGLRHPEVPTAKWVSYDERIKFTDLLDLRYTDGYCNRKTVFMASQHSYTPHFEALAKIARRFGKDWHAEDGGSTYMFEEWLAKRINEVNR